VIAAAGTAVQSASEGGPILVPFLVVVGIIYLTARQFFGVRRERWAARRRYWGPLFGHLGRDAIATANLVIHPMQWRMEKRRAPSSDIDEEWRQFNEGSGDGFAGV